MDSADFDDKGLSDDLLDDKESFNASDIISVNLIQEKVEVMRNPVNLSIVTGSKFPGMTTNSHKTPTKSVTPTKSITPERTIFESVPSDVSPKHTGRVDLALANTSKTNSVID